MSGSLLLIAVVWLVLLAPLLLRNQRPVRRTSPALNDTRVLHEGGAPLPTKRKLRPTESLYHPDVDDKLELLDAEPEYVIIDDERGTVTSSREAQNKNGNNRTARSTTMAGRLSALARSKKNQAPVAETATSESADEGVQDAVETVDAVEIMEPESPVRRRPAEATASAVPMTTDNDTVTDIVETVDAEIAEPEEDTEDTNNSEAPAGSENGSANGATTGVTERPADAEESIEESIDETIEIVDGEVLTTDEADKVSVDNTSQPSNAGREKCDLNTNFKGHDETDTGEFAPVTIFDKLGDRLRPRVARKEGAAATDPQHDDAPEETNHAAAEAAGDTAAERLHYRRQSRFDAIPAAYLRGGDVHPREDVTDTVDAPAVQQADLALAEESDEPSAADLAYVNSRRGRGVYDPVASRQRELQRLRRRKQVLLVLAAATIVSFVLAFILGGALWWAPAVSLGFTVFYLVVLRKQAIEEQKLRHRRMARMRRARLGVRNAEDDELGVPDRLQRPGAIIVETDDVDLEFQHLDYIDGSQYFDDPHGADPYYPRRHPDDSIFESDDDAPVVVRRHVRAV